MAQSSLNKQELDKSTEEKILTAAKKIFTQKGYAATKVRDIALEADINLSLVNYYFRTKEKLFERIMIDNVNNLFEKIGPILNDETTTLHEKIQAVVEHYIDLLIANPDFPVFIVNEILSGSNRLPAIESKREMILHSHFARQILGLQAAGKIPFHPIQIIMTLVGMIIMPFLSRTIFDHLGISKEEFTDIMEARKQLIPVWIDAIIGQ